jgi:alpha/beta superfamily hydrolase
MSEIFFNGEEGRIEGKFHQAEDNKAPVALVLHPHPQYGGNMNNKVVYNTYRSLIESGFSVLRINFRGVGKSQGKFDNGVGELTDAAAAMDWLQLQLPLAREYWLAGFSFGAWISMQLLMRRPEIKRFIGIAPPVEKFDFSFLSPCPIPGLIAQGDQDSIAPEDSVVEMVEKITKQKGERVDYRVVKGADHFFRGKLEDLKEVIKAYVKQNSGVSDNLEGIYDSEEESNSGGKVMLDDLI